MAQKSLICILFVFEIIFKIFTYFFFKQINFINVENIKKRRSGLKFLYDKNTLISSKTSVRISNET